MFMRFLLLLTFNLSVLFLMAQIVDDTTKLVYGFHSISYTEENDLLNNTKKTHAIDTALIDGFERHSFMQKGRYKYQNLGNFGTATYPIFPLLNERIGATSGFEAYRVYDANPNSIKYFDTKSPYIQLFSYLGGENRNIVDVLFSRNIHKDWNFGFDLKKITTDKLMAVTEKGDRQTVSTFFNIYTSYKSKKTPYQALASYAKSNNQINEIGGGRFQSDSLLSDYFQYARTLVRLSDAKGTYKTSQLHLLHEYDVANQYLSIYHKFDRREEKLTYDDESESTASDGYNPYLDFYPNFFLSDELTAEAANFISLSNEVGLKGELPSLFYRLYGKWRTAKFSYNNVGLSSTKVSERYLGGYIRFNWKEKFLVEGDLNIFLIGKYYLDAKMSSEILNIRYQSKIFMVPFIYQFYAGNHYEWDNDFSAVFSNQVNADLKVNFNFLELRPKVTLTTFTNYVYLDESSTPTQSERSDLVYSIGGDVNFKFIGKTPSEGIFIENEVLISNSSADYFRVPFLFLNGRYYWQKKWFNQSIPIGLGIETHVQSSYSANAYNPVIQQFYLENMQKNIGYFRSDLFVNMKLSNFFFTLRWNYLNQSRDEGYFTTPYYASVPRTVDLIVRWSFFD